MARDGPQKPPFGIHSSKGVGWDLGLVLTPQPASTLSKGALFTSCLLFGLGIPLHHLGCPYLFPKPSP